MGSSKEKKAKNKKNKKHRGGGSETPAYEESGRAGKAFTTFYWTKAIFVFLSEEDREKRREKKHKKHDRESEERKKKKKDKKKKKSKEEKDSWQVESVGMPTWTI